MNSTQRSLALLGALAVLLNGCIGGSGSDFSGGSGNSGSYSRELVSCSQSTDFFDELLHLTNQERQSRSIAPLSLSSELIEAAQRHSKDIARNSLLGHTGSDGSSVADRATDAGYGHTYVGENVFAGRPSAADAVRWWMSSPGHRRNILKTEYTEIGLGFFQESGSQYGQYWTQVFGDRPAGAKTASPATALPPSYANDCAMAAQPDAVSLALAQSASIPEPSMAVGLVAAISGLALFRRRG